MNLSKESSAPLRPAASLALRVSPEGIRSCDFSSAPLLAERESATAIYLGFEETRAGGEDFAGCAGRLEFDLGSFNTPKWSSYFVSPQGCDEKPKLSSSGWRVLTTGSLVDAAKFAEGAVFSRRFPGSLEAFLEVEGAGPWMDPEVSVGYLGFRQEKTGALAWARIEYDGRAGTLLLLGLCYDPRGLIRAGLVSAE